MKTSYDIVVVGSGFGASVMAARLGQHLRVLGREVSVAVLERGGDPTGQLDGRARGGAINDQGNRFRHSLSPAYLTRHAEWYADRAATIEDAPPSMSVIGGKGLGGGSNIYCGVSLRAPSSVFERTREGRRIWPRMYSRAMLDPYYAEVERMLKVRKLAWTDRDTPHWALTTKRDFVFAEGCRRIGARAEPLKVATLNDANEGWWTQGQRFEGRQNLSKNYLAVAKEVGVEFHTDCEVESVRPVDDRYVVRGVDVRNGDTRRFEIECRILVLGAGAVGTSGILMRSENDFDGDRHLDEGFRRGAPRLGRGLSGNGDYGVTGMIGRDFEFPVEGQKGKPMSSFCPTFFGEHQFILIPFYAEPIYFSMGQISTLQPAANHDAVGRRSTTVGLEPDGTRSRDWGEAYKNRLRQFTPRMLTMGCLALDEGEGEIYLGTDRNAIHVRWRDTHPETERRWSAAISAMQRIYRALGGEMYLDAYRRDGTVNTAHPLGGAAMTEYETPELGIVSQDGELLRNPNIFVTDGAMIPAALGVNPSLTIAAVAESIADRLIRGVGTRSIRERLA